MKQMKSPTFASFLALLALLASVQGAIMAHAQTVNGWTNYSDPNGKWTIQYPSYWLAGNPKTNISIMNESMFTSGNGSVVIIAVTVNHPIKTLSNNGYQFNCDTTLLAGHRTC